MDRKTLKTTRIFEERKEDETFCAEWFAFKQKKFISHIDTLYFMVKPKCENWRDDERKKKLFSVLQECDAAARETGKPVPVFGDIYAGLEVEPFMGIKMYSYNFALVDSFNVFLCEHPPTDKTTPIFIQIRSQSLWLDGLRKSFDKACDCIERVLKHFGLETEELTENRIDYAFHTNYIQDMMHYFPEDKLKEMQVSNFERWHKEGCFYEDMSDCDYFTLGRRKSNNVFFRVYNKTKEVIELGYKQFFIAIWLKEGLISKFDEFVLSNAFVKGEYFSKDKARCEFYCQYGEDYGIKREIAAKLNDPETPLGWFTKRAKGLVPDITLVCNVEFQTKRKFYDRLGKSIPCLSEEPTFRRRMYSIFEQMHAFVQFLTHDTIRFLKYKGKYAEVPRIKRPNADWWDRLRATKPLEYSDEWIVDYFRSYQISLDAERMKLLTVSKVARNSVYDSSADIMKVCGKEDVGDDLTAFLSGLNDNDIKKYAEFRLAAARDLERKRGKMGVEYECGKEN